MVPVLVALVVCSVPVQSAKEPVLLALTPVIDGNVGSEEWLPFSDDAEGKTYFQWEPGSYHFAATLAAGEDLVIDLDLDGDGWLVGDDNREVRVHESGGRASVTVRTLSALGRQGPAWAGTSPKAVSAIASEADGKWTVEGNVAFNAERIVEGRTVGVLMDVLPAGGDAGPAYLPRALHYLRLGFDAATGIPEGLGWHSKTKLREVAREDQINLSFELNGAGNYSTAEIRCEGWGRDDLTTVTKEFMGFNRKGQASFEYSSEIAPEAPAGWRIVRATLKNPDGSETVLRTSIKIADLIEFELKLPEQLVYTPEARTIRGSLLVRSTGVGRVEGRYDVAVDRTWAMKKGGPQRILIYNPRGREQINLEIVVPAGSAGEFPVTFTVTVGAKTFTKSVVIAISPPGR